MLMTLMGGPNTGANGVQTQSSGVLGESAADSGDDMLRNIKFQVARRDVGAATQPFAPFPGPGGPNAGASGAVTTGLSITNGKLVITGAQQLDGEYVVLIPTDGLIVSSNGQPIKTGNVGDASAVRFSVGGVYAVAVVMFAMLVL